MDSSREHTQITATEAKVLFTDFEKKFQHVEGATKKLIVDILLDIMAKLIAAEVTRELKAAMDEFHDSSTWDEANDEAFKIGEPNWPYI
jgi:hypothetical protein